MIVVRDKGGNVIEEVKNYDEGAEVISRFEAEDKEDGTYTPDFYEVVGLDKEVVQ